MRTKDEHFQKQRSGCLSRREDIRRKLATLFCIFDRIDTGEDRGSRKAVYSSLEYQFTVLRQALVISPTQRRRSSFRMPSGLYVLRIKFDHRTERRPRRKQFSPPTTASSLTRNCVLSPARSNDNVRRRKAIHFAAIEKKHIISSTRPENCVRVHRGWLAACALRLTLR